MRGFYRWLGDTAERMGVDAAGAVSGSSWATILRE